MHDRRRHQRYLFEQSCFLTYAASVGTIIDISMGGISCMCLEENRCSKDSQEREIDIFCKTEKLLAQGLPIKVLDSIVVSGNFNMGLSCRKCRVQFEQLEHNQKTYLEEIILSHAILPTLDSEENQEEL
jgi:PilZ domain-containing protein